jgi:trans-L-3-hydroxyproline dehydratase
MYGVWPVEPDLPGADLAVLFLHNEGFSTMCGHATIALGRYAVEEGIVAAPAAGPGETVVVPVRLQAPCGAIEVRVDVTGGVVGEVRFTSVPAFAAALDVEVEVAGVGHVTLDVAYGGAFYAVVAADAIGVELDVTPLATLVERADAVTRAARAAAPLVHPDADDLAFLYGTIVVDVPDALAPPVSRNVCVFADRQVDRSPTGSGVTARMALRYARGSVAAGVRQRFAGITGEEFTAEVVAEHPAGQHAPEGIASVEVEVAGRAYRTGTSSFTFDDADPLRSGFLLR